MRISPPVPCSDCQSANRQGTAVFVVAPEEQGSTYALLYLCICGKRIEWSRLSGLCIQAEQAE